MKTREGEGGSKSNLGIGGKVKNAHGSMKRGRKLTMQALVGDPLEVFLHG